MKRITNAQLQMMLELHEYWLTREEAEDYMS